MTAEVAIMNQQALVFAADSVITVTHWVKDQKEVRYFKGANKLFQLSDIRPVGMMIFGSAALHSVPWEIIVKDFRNDLDVQACRSLSEYARRFFGYVESHTGLFPDVLKRKLFADYAVRSASYNLRLLKDSQPAAFMGARERYERFALRLERLTAQIGAMEIPKPLLASDIDAAVVEHAAEVERRICEELDPEIFSDLAPQLAETSIRATMKRYDLFLGETGIVIGGYGDDDYFPAFDVFKCMGFLDRKFIVLPQEDSARIDRDKPAIIVPFATTSMINTFQMGIGPDIYSSVDTATRKCLREFAAGVAARLGHAGDVPGLDELVANALDAHRREWFLPSFSDHHGPMARVIGSLPAAEMAALAKSLIELQSLKERVTLPSESVGGPVDVAVMSKHDGFVWIERKHYFRQELNPRFFARRHYLTGRYRVEEKS